MNAKSSKNVRSYAIRNVAEVTQFSVKLHKNNFAFLSIAGTSIVITDGVDLALT